jgi:fused signal recognition particle receptor
MEAEAARLVAEAQKLARDRATMEAEMKMARLAAAEAEAERMAEEERLAAEIAAAEAEAEAEAARVAEAEQLAEQRAAMDTEAARLDAEAQKSAEVTAEEEARQLAELEGALELAELQAEVEMAELESVLEPPQRQPKPIAAGGPEPEAEWMSAQLHVTAEDYTGSGMRHANARRARRSTPRPSPRSRRRIREVAADSFRSSQAAVETDEAVTTVTNIDTGPFTAEAENQTAVDGVPMNETGHPAQEIVEDQVDKGLMTERLRSGCQTQAAPKQQAPAALSTTATAQLVENRTHSDEAPSDRLTSVANERREQSVTLATVEAMLAELQAVRASAAADAAARAQHVAALEEALANQREDYQARLARAEDTGARFFLFVQCMVGVVCLCD